MVMTAGFGPANLGSIPCMSLTINFYKNINSRTYGLMVMTAGFGPANLGSIPGMSFNCI